MYEKAKYVCFIYMQPQKVRFKYVQTNMKQVSYMYKDLYHYILKCPKDFYRLDFNIFLRKLVFLSIWHASNFKHHIQHYRSLL